MDMRDLANKVWEKQFGDLVKVHDYHGREIEKGDYSNEKSRFCWILEFIYPTSLGGKVGPYNVLPVHLLTHVERNGNYPNYKLRNNHGLFTLYQIKKINKNKKDGYQIIKDPYQNPQVVASTSINS